MKKAIIAISTIFLTSTSFAGMTKVMGYYPGLTSGKSNFEVRFNRASIPNQNIPKELREHAKYGGLKLKLSWDITKESCQLVEISIDEKELVKKLRDDSYEVKNVYSRCRLRHIPAPVTPPTPPVSDNLEEGSAQ